MIGIRLIYQNSVKATCIIVVLFLMINFFEARAYPPAVGLVGKAKNCLSCHINNGPWKDDDNLIIDIIETSSLTKFAPGWNVNLPMACRIVGDHLDIYKGSDITVLPMSIRPTDAAINANLTLQVMLTKGKSVKSKPKEGMIGNYYKRIVKFKVLD